MFPQKILYFTTYYLGNVSKALVKDIRCLIQESYPQIHLRVLYKSYNTIGSNFSFKDKVPELCLCNLIYKYTCERSQAFYIGKTQVHFNCRISQHQGVSARTGDDLDSKMASDVRDHCFKCKVYVKEENFTILDRLQNKNGLLILETLHQKTKKPTIGVHQQSTPVLCFD